MKKFGLVAMVLAAVAVMAVPVSAADQEQNNQAFFEAIKDDMIQSAKETGIPASVTAAVAALESDFGQSKLAVSTNNLFGLRGEYDGEYAIVTQKVNGKYGAVRYRKFPDAKTGISEYNKYLRQNRRRYGNLSGKGWREALDMLQVGGYSADPNYASKLSDIIHAYDLGEWDDAKTLTLSRRAEILCL